MTRTKFDLLATNVINVILFVIIFCFGFIRWQKLEEVVVESNNSQKRFRDIHSALINTVELTNLGEQVYGWTDEDVSQYKAKLAEAGTLLDRLGGFYPTAKTDSMKSVLNEKGRLLLRIHETTVKRSENENRLTKDRRVTVKDSVTTIMHRTGHIFRSSSEEVTSKTKNRTVLVPSVNQAVMTEQAHYGMELCALNDSLAGVNRWLDVNMRQILNADVKTAEREQEQLQAKASCIGHTTFMWGMTLLFVAFFLNIGNSYRRARTVKKLESESEKNMHLYKSRREMMYMVTHELRTPLSPVIGYSSLMKQTANLDKTNKKYLDKIYESAEKMKTLINSLLEYFAIESDKTDIAKKPFNMKNMAEMMTATYALEARQKGLEFIANDCENLALMGDESKLIQIGSNLLANAVKFTEAGSVSLNVTYEDDALKIEISDTGIGIAEEEQQKIFEPFKQLGKAKAMATDGIGLGLSIVSQLVKLMDGNIELQSRVGEGSRFTVTIPVERMTEDNYAVAEKKPTEDDGIRRVLAIDDTESFLDMMRDILRENGVECDTCMKAKELVEHMREKDYDLLVIDLKMPEINGIELAQTLRESEVGNSKSVKMVVSTAWSDDHDVHELLDKGFDGILSKPFNTQDLMDMVNRFIPRGRKREVPDLSNASLNILPKLIKEVEDGVTALKEGLERNDIEQVGEWCHRLAGSWGMIHADEPLDELHELLKSQETMDGKALQTVIGKVEAMGNTIVRKAKERIRELENE